MSKLELVSTVLQIQEMLLSTELAKNHIDSTSVLTKSQIRRLRKHELAGTLLKLLSNYVK